MTENHDVPSDDPEAARQRDTDRRLERLRAKGYRIGAVQAVFSIGDTPGHLRYVVNGVPLDRAQLQALEQGRLKLPSHPTEEARRAFPALPSP
jgi:hypothetical protein